MTRPRCLWFGTDSTSWFSRVNSIAVVAAPVVPICMTTVFWGLKRPCQLEAHEEADRIPSWRRRWPASDLAVEKIEYNRASSAYNDVEVGTAAGRSLMKTVKRIGPR